MSPEPLRARLRDHLGDLGESLSGAVRQRGVRLLRRTTSGRPLVTAVVLLHGPETHARATLDAVRDQQLARLEIVPVVMDERLRPLAEQAAREDWRVRPTHVERPDWALARQFGSVQARSRWLLFLAPRQLLLPGAVEALLAARGGGTSTFPGTDAVVLGGLEGAGDEWARTPLLGRLLVPRELWGKTLDDAEPDGQTAAVSLLAEGHATAGRDTLRDGATRAQPFEKVTDPMLWLSVRVASDRSTLATLERDGLMDERAVRAAGALARDLPRFWLGAEHADDAQWDLLVSHTAELLEIAGPDGLAGLPVEDRVAAWLAAEGRRDALVEYVASRRFAGGHLHTFVHDGEVHARFDGLADVPDEVLHLDEDESGLRAQARRLVTTEDHLELELFAGLRHVDQGTDVPEVTVRLVGEQPAPELETELTPDSAVTRWMREPFQYHDHGVVHLRIPESALSPGSWLLELDLEHSGVRRSGRVRELETTGSAAGRVTPAGFEVRLDRAPDGVALVVEPAAPAAAPTGPVALVREVTGEPGRLRLDLDLPEGATVALVGGGTSFAATPDGDGWLCELVTDPWQLGPVPALPGGYRLAVRLAAEDVPVRLSAAVEARLPLVEVDELHRRTLGRGPHGGLLLRLDAPLTDDEAGAWAQRQLQQAHLEVTDPLDPGLVYFQSFLGQSPTDHPAAIQAELHRVLEERGRLDVRLLWAVADSSVRVPEGAEPVLLRSREWYAALARAAYVVTNIELDPWFRRRDGQEVLETYHGYPSKAMGLSQWRGRGLTPTHQRQMLARTSGTWNNLLTPIPEMDRYYRENYEFEGRIIAQGYPRTDSLVAPGHEERREAARARLGIDADQTAVLYAPTWRDDLATNFRSAQAVLHLDVQEAAAGLGPDHVVLLRGHRFHSVSAKGAQVVDVTSYPEVNDLILAADVAVLDYSSMRFDVALTGRPMVFLVPDLEHYTEETRGFLYPFAESAPGPFVRTTAEVVAAIADLPSLQRVWAPRIAEFNARYNRLNDGRAAERVVAEFFGGLLGNGM